jgi:hypothetical protein
MCDRCADRRVARITGYPELPEPPPPANLPGPDGREHRLQFRVWRAPTGIEVEPQETGVADPDDGNHFAVLGSHDADVDALVEAVTRRATDGIAKQQLEPHPHRAGWLLRDDDVAGRLVWGGEREHGGPCDVVVDGPRLTWDELGHALEPYEGWRFRLVLEDPCDDLRPDADVIAMSAPRAQEVQPMSGTAGRQTIDEALAEFLVEQEKRLASRTFRSETTPTSSISYGTASTAMAINPSMPTSAGDGRPRTDVTRRRLFTSSGRRRSPTTSVSSWTTS